MSDEKKSPGVNRDARGGGSPNHTDDWRPATRADPCAICGKGDWCARTSDGAARCMRYNEAPAGWRVVKHCDDGGTVYRRDDDLSRNGKPYKNTQDHRRHPTPSGTKPPEKKAQSKAWPTLDDALEELTRSKGKPTAIYGYDDADGEPCGCVLRWDQPDGKSILPLRRDPDGWRLGAMRAPRALYRLADLTRRHDETIFVLEGEKCADAATSVGLLATTSVGGSKAPRKSDWGALTGRDVVLLPDHDEPGERYADDVVRLALAAGARSVRVVRLADTWPDLPAGGDLCDMIGCEGPWGTWTGPAVKAAIEALAADAEPIVLDETEEADEGAVIVNMGDVEPQQIRWLWPGRFALGKLTILVGDPGLGKSLVSLDMTARVTTGRPWPDAPGVSIPVGGVVLLSAEDDPGDTIRPRLDAADADVSRVNLIRAIRRRPPYEPGRDQPPAVVESMFDLTRDLAALESTIARTPDCRLVVIDPITAYLGGTDSHKNADIRALLAPLSDLASRSGVAVVAVTHLNKNAGGKAIYRTMGSLAFNAAARAVWGVAKDKDDPSRRLVLPVKNNLAGDVQGMAYTIESTGRDGLPFVAWDPDPVGIDIDAALGRDVDGAIDDDGGDGSAERKKLLRWVETEGGEVTARQAQRAFRRLRQSSALARDALDELVEAGLGTWAYRKSGTQHLEVFRLEGVTTPLTPGDGDTSPPHGLETGKVSPPTGMGEVVTPQPEGVADRLDAGDWGAS